MVSTRSPSADEAPTLSRLIAQYRALNHECVICEQEPLFWLSEKHRGACDECTADVLESLAEFPD